MKGLSDKEIEILLLLIKDFSADYNANSISKKVSTTPAGAFKAMKSLQKRGLVVGKKMGRAVFYKVNLEDYYTLRIMETLLISDSRAKASRWLDEFEGLFAHAEIIIVFGSIVKDSKKANDIDLLAVLKKEKAALLNSAVKERRLISTRPIHLIKQTLQELGSNLKKRDKVILNILKNGYVLWGYEKLLGVLKDVARFK